ncbi:RNA polymerase sigma factor [Ferribacterium limneticum]|uniref:RNA polymerase sigma factor n=1 Tax=Ferribacterium limneticum TaxID=76259 RepID=UPI00384EB4EA
MLGDRAAADDLVQDTLERAWNRFAQWRAGSDLRAWLFGIMHNLRVDQLRCGSLPTHSLDDDACEVPTRATQNDRLEVMDIESALRQLPDDQREVLLLVGLEEMTYAEIAAALGIPIGTVMSRLSRGRERLRQIMEGRQSGANLRVVR